jgi:hypothetical protein
MSLAHRGSCASPDVIFGSHSVLKNPSPIIPDANATAPADSCGDGGRSGGLGQRDLVGEELQPGLVGGGQPLREQATEEA